MEYKRLGNSGLVVSEIGLGCNYLGLRPDLDAARAKSVVETALDQGITLIDTADTYGGQGRSEEFVGQALSKRRDDVVLATKFGHDARGLNGPDWGARASRRYIRRAVEGSLRRLDTDWIDLYQIHQRDESTPIEETLSVLTDLVHEGKVRYLGCCNYKAWELVEAVCKAESRCLEGFISAQNYYSILSRSLEEELVPAAQQFGVGILPYFPLENGLLTGKYKRGVLPPTGSRLSEDQHQEILQNAPWDAIEALEAFAGERNITIIDVAIGGLAAEAGVASVLVGATSPAQVESNAAAARWKPTPSDLRILREITRKQTEHAGT